MSETTLQQVRIETPQARVTRLLQEHRLALYGYIFSCVRKHCDAEDVFQEVAIAVTQSIDDVHDESGFLPWAREIARRRVLASFRAASRERAHDPELIQRLAEASERVERAQPASEYHEALLTCLDGLSERCRQLIALRYDDTTEVAELAQRFGRTVQATYAQIKRIKQVLRECVQRRLESEQRLVRD